MRVRTFKISRCFRLGIVQAEEFSGLLKMYAVRCAEIRLKNFFQLGHGQK